ncbi:MAG TPA: thioredoxin domain-containing protein [Pyrinomonadaceae bacterium]
MRRVVPLLIIVGVLAVSVLGAWYLKRSAASSELTTDQRQGRKSSPAKQKLGATPAHERGPSSAPVMLEEFADFECHACGVIYPIMKQVEQEFGSQIVVVFREYPLAMHKNGMTAAQAAEAAGLQNKFWEMHDVLFQNQKEWHQVADVRPLYRGYASQVGIDVEKFERDMASDEVAKRIAADRERGGWVGIESTPTVFLNGREVPFETLTAADKFKELVRAELNSPEKKN